MSTARRRRRKRRRPFFMVAFNRATLLGLLAVSLVFGIVIAKGFVTVPASAPVTQPVVFIDAGHGGIDPGACGREHAEKDIVLKVSLLLGVRLEKAGAKVVYTRIGDYDLETDDIGDVAARIKLMNESKPSAVVSIHCNAFTDSYERGAQTFYNSTGHKDSEELARLIQDELIASTGTEREISARLDHFILDNTDAPAATVELGFLSNPNEEELLGSGEYQQKLAECLYRGIAAFLDFGL
jgi:N-acetylmuramoyl-L-alanine amidase